MFKRFYPAAAAAALTLAASAAHAATDVATNPYGLEALWKGGDLIARGTLLILIVMSMGSWYIIVAKLLEQARVLRRAKAAETAFWNASTLAEGARALDEDSPFRFIAQAGLSAWDHHDGALLEQIDLDTWVTTAVERATNTVSNRLQDGLAFLGTVGSTAPFVGLFGTVWGIYHALTAIGIAGQASIDKVAGPVGESLIMTAFGLAVAIPAVLGYNALTRGNKSIIAKLNRFAHDLHAYFVTGARLRPGSQRDDASVRLASVKQQ